MAETAKLIENKNDKSRNFTPEIQELLQYEGNNTCADCLSKSI